MKFRKSMIAVLCTAALGAIAVPTTASAEVGIFFNIAPPPPRHEPIPAPRSGYVWSSGYWNARGNKHVWQAGHWERERTGYYRTQPTWKQQDRWELQRGGWSKGDRDGDGIPNRVDRDRDGDGVPNRVDGAPNNAYRN